MLRETDPSIYTHLFEPRLESGPSGFRTPPRPFVVRVAELNARRFEAGESFDVGINLFDLRHAEQMTAALNGALQRMASRGVGPLRSRLELVGKGTEELVHVELEPEKVSVSRLEIEFVTPTSFHGFNAQNILLFGLLFRRVRDRISILSSLYGAGQHDNLIDLAERADRIETIHQRLIDQELDRRSSKTGETHPIGGFTGQAVFEGDLAPFLPWVRAGAYTGVGTKTVWGNGQIRLNSATPGE